MVFRVEHVAGVALAVVVVVDEVLPTVAKAVSTPEGRVYSTYGSTVPTSCLVRVAAPVLLEYKPEELFSQIRVFSDSPFCQFVLMP